MAFFPCIYFCAASQMLMSFGDLNYRKLTTHEKAEKVLERARLREKFFTLIVKLYATAEQRGLRMIIENPWSEQTFLKSNFVAAPTLIDKNRMLRGDYFMKPTAYWFVNAEPTHGCSEQNDKKKKTIWSAKSSSVAGVCSEDRSMLSSDYARNFICDFIIGKHQEYTIPSLF